MRVFVTRHEELHAYSTAAKAVEAAIEKGWGDAEVYVGLDKEKNESITYTLQDNVRRAIKQIKQNGFITIYSSHDEKLEIEMLSVK